MKVLEQADGSDDAFDDSFYIANLLECLGRLDNFSYTVDIANEIIRHLKLDQITHASPHHVISISAIKAYFSMRAQIFLYLNKKEVAMDKGMTMP
jgi:hypothetical protein